MSRSGPVEAHAWPTSLAARVVEIGPRPRIHGYDVESDLARHYGFLDVAFLCLASELPSEAASRALSVALTFLAPVGVDEPPAHAASIARMCGAKTAGVIGVAAIAAAERARCIMSEHGELVVWLERGEGPLPARFHARDDDDRASAQRLLLAVSDVVDASRFASGSRVAVAIAVLFAAGLRDPARIEAAIALAALPAAIAEGLETKPGSFESYPMNTPPFEYEEP